MTRCERGGGASPSAGRWPARMGRTIRKRIGRIDGTLTLWYVRAQSRRELVGLDERLLKDVGIDRFQAYNEARKPFWRNDTDSTRERGRRD